MNSKKKNVFKKRVIGNISSAGNKVLNCGNNGLKKRKVGLSNESKEGGVKEKKAKKKGVLNPKQKK